MTEHIVSETILDAPGRPYDKISPPEAPRHDHKPCQKYFHDQRNDALHAELAFRQPVDDLSDILRNIQVRHIHQHQNGHSRNVKPYIL